MCTVVSKRIASDDLAPGMLVTVLQGEQIPQHGLSGGDLVELRSLEWYSALRGDPLRVLQVQIPYATVEVVHLAHKPHLILDTRRCVLVSITEQYAKSAAQPALPAAVNPRKWWQFWGGP